MDVAATTIGAGQMGEPARRIQKHWLTYDEPDPSPRSPTLGALCAMSCTSLALLISGIVFLARSHSNRRDMLVAEYDGTVSGWASSARTEFGTARFNVVAHTSLNAKDPLQMVPSDAADFTLKDSEDGEGVDEYQPLKYTAALEFPPGWRNASSSHDEGALDLFPVQAKLVQLAFQFYAPNIGGSATQLGTVAFPMFSSEATQPFTEYPETDCRAFRHGIWKGRHCHVLNRLIGVCVLVEPDGMGGWRLLHRGGNATAPKLSGCDPGKGWNPAVYVRDVCWGRWPDRRRCAGEAWKHLQVKVTLRSAADPFLQAERLTHDHFDFGPSAQSELTAGMVFMVLGCLLAIVPVLRLGQALRTCTCSLGDDEEHQSLSGAVAGDT